MPSSRAGRPSPRADLIGLESRLLLRAAGSPDATLATASWAEFKRLVPEGSATPPLRRLLPAVCRNLARVASVREMGLLHAYVGSFGANAPILQSTAAALRALNGVQIPAMVLKGTALLVAHYGDAGIRPMSDADVLVPRARIGEALDVLESAGFRGDPSRAWLRTEMHAGTLTRSGMTLDLHRHALYEARYVEADEAFFAGSAACEVMGVPCRVMSVEDQLIHSIVHGLRWSIAPSDIWILDVVNILRANEVDGERLRNRAASLRLIVPLRRGLELTRSVFEGEGRLDLLIARLEEEDEPISERIEHGFRVREPSGPLGSMPNLWFAYQRSGAPRRMRVRGFPAFLAQVWRLDSPARLPATLLEKLRRRGAA
jgi:hypothetical protein